MSALYLYGITRRGSLPLIDVQGDAAPAQLLEFSELAAVVRAVPLDEFSPPRLAERMQDEKELEALVRRHNGLVESIHAAQPILPAKFGMVYARAEDVVSALEPGHDELLRQLEHVSGCDEWAIHLYANRAVLREHIAVEDASIRRLREAHAVARPGRAYFIEQQLRAELDEATEQALVDVGQHVFERLAACAVAGRVSAALPAGSTGDEEVLRAAFLVRREGADRFGNEARACAGDIEGLRCECTGPWAPYSFAAAANGDGR